MFKAITPAGATYLARTTAVSKAARLERSLARIHWARERGRTGGESRARGTANSRGIAGTRRHHDDAPAVLALLVSRALGRRLARHAACNRGARAHAAGADVVLGARVVIVAGRAVGPVLNDAEAPSTTDCPVAQVYGDTLAVGVALASDTAFGQRPCANSSSAHVVRSARVQIVTRGAVGHVLDAAEAVGAGRPLALVVWGRALARVLALVAPAGGGVEGFSWGAILDAGVVAGAQRLAGCTSADLAAALGVLDAIT